MSLRPVCQTVVALSDSLGSAWSVRVALSEKIASPALGSSSARL